ncbi:MAG: ABC transporter permease [Deltaproteobacteria bacterium]|nr:ABC transporter permease [Deltaproteobacteria bacterium]
MGIRELLYFLAWRDIRVRYKQTVLGVAWVVIQPFLLMLVLPLGKLAKIPSEGIPYPIFAYTALLPWQLFAKGLNEASTSLVANERIITKVYFPRLIVPASAVFAALVDFAIAFGLLILLMLYYGIMPGLAVLTLPLFVLLAAMTALGVGFWFSALDVQYRDIRYTIPFLTQLWFFATPIVYPLSMVPEKWRILLSLNPMCGVVEGFRWALLGKEHLMVLPLLISVAVVFLVFIGGLYFFRHVEKTLADVI